MPLLHPFLVDITGFDPPGGGCVRSAPHVSADKREAGGFPIISYVQGPIDCGKEGVISRFAKLDDYQTK